MSRCCRRAPGSPRARARSRSTRPSPRACSTLPSSTPPTGFATCARPCSSSRRCGPCWSPGAARSWRSPPTRCCRSRSRKASTPCPRRGGATGCSERCVATSPPPSASRSRSRRCGCAAWTSTGPRSSEAPPRSVCPCPPTPSSVSATGSTARALARATRRLPARTPPSTRCWAPPSRSPRSAACCSPPASRCRPTRGLATTPRRAWCCCRARPSWSSPCTPALTSAASRCRSCCWRPPWC